MARPVRRESLRIEEFSDREFLLIVGDLAAADRDGWVDSQEVADALGLAHRRSASSRLSWLRRYGAVEREIARDEHGQIRTHRNGEVVWTQRWCLTKLGEDVANGRLRKSAQTMLDGLSDAQLVTITRMVTDRTRNSDTAGHLIKREWRFGTSNLRS